jgi:hypothetical protein
MIIQAESIVVVERGAHDQTLVVFNPTRTTISKLRSAEASRRSQVFKLKDAAGEFTCSDGIGEKLFVVQKVVQSDFHNTLIAEVRWVG